MKETCVERGFRPCLTQHSLTKRIHPTRFSCPISNFVGMRDFLPHRSSASSSRLICVVKDIPVRPNVMQGHSKMTESRPKMSEGHPEMSQSHPEISGRGPEVREERRQINQRLPTIVKPQPKTIKRQPNGKMGSYEALPVNLSFFTKA